MRTKVSVGGNVYIHYANTHCDIGDGWPYIDDTKTTIRPCGDTCGALKVEGDAQADVDC